MVLQNDKRRQVTKSGRGDYLHSRGGVYYFRRAVPPDARAAFGKREVLVSLHTSSLAEARHLLLPELVRYEATLATVRGAVAPADRVVQPVARPTSEDLISAVRDWLRARNSRSRERIEGLRTADEEAFRAGLEAERTIMDGVSIGDIAPPSDTDWIASQLIDQNGWSISEGDPEYRRLRRLLGHARVEANESAMRQLLEAPPRFVDDRFDLSVDRGEPEPMRRKVSLAGMCDDFIAERRPAPSTITAYKKAWGDFCSFLKHDDAAKVSRKDVLDWKGDLTRVGGDGSVRSDRTIRDKYLVPVKSILAWAVENQRLAENPAEKVRMRVKKSPRLHGGDDLTETEARLILAATLVAPSTTITVEMANARRWVPWLCAYTGARIGEMTQLRSEDVLEVDGVPAIRITPEAGATKDHNARVVALHSHLIEQGFVEWAAAQSGPLFYSPSRARGGSVAHPQHKKTGERLGKWVRSPEVGVTRLGVKPNHGWRHRFITEARRSGMAEEVQRAITGHAPSDVSATYGSVPVEAMKAAIDRMPKYLLLR